MEPTTSADQIDDAVTVLVFPNLWIPLHVEFVAETKLSIRRTLDDIDAVLTAVRALLSVLGDRSSSSSGKDRQVVFLQRRERTEGRFSETATHKFLPQ